MQVMLIDDEPMIRQGIEQTLLLADIPVTSFASAKDVLPLLHADFPGIIISDVRLPEMSGLELQQHCQTLDPAIPVILITGHGDVSMAVQAMRDGAYDFIEKPFATEHLISIIRRAMEARQLTLENRRLREKLTEQEGISSIIVGHSQAIKDVRNTILALAQTDADVLVHGETGTGKELVARCLHDYSQRQKHHFVALNCGAMPESVFESEVFGHEAGAFTGAIKKRIGKLEYANGGSIFLDEIETMPLSLQVKLLRVLQERKIERLGANESISIDCRIIAATKEDLAKASEQGKFRSDLYYRLNVVTLKLPALRERREDIPALFEYFVLAAAVRYQRAAPIATTAQIHELLAYPWPGNIRELKNAAERFVLGLVSERFDLGQTSPLPVGLSQQLNHFERTLLEEALRKTQGQVQAASDLLQIPRKTLYDKLNKYQLSADFFRE
jgi:two-component system C4-dicarboxylate transport response regulator DctD